MALVPLSWLPLQAAGPARSARAFRAGFSSRCHKAGVRSSRRVEDACGFHQQGASLPDQTPKNSCFNSNLSHSPGRAFILGCGWEAQAMLVGRKVLHTAMYCCRLPLAASEPAGPGLPEGDLWCLGSSGVYTSASGRRIEAKQTDDTKFNLSVCIPVLCQEVVC